MQIAFSTGTPPTPGARFRQIVTVELKQFSGTHLAGRHGSDSNYRPQPRRRTLSSLGFEIGVVSLLEAEELAKRAA
jgi:hypothetical protein